MSFWRFLCQQFCCLGGEERESKGRAWWFGLLSEGIAVTSDEMVRLPSFLEQEDTIRKVNSILKARSLCPAHASIREHPRFQLDVAFLPRTHAVQAWSALWQRTTRRDLPRVYKALQEGTWVAGARN